MPNNTPPPLTGDDYELIDRLIWICGDGTLDDAHWWDTITHYIAGNVSGADLIDHMPDTGVEFPPGSIGATMREESIVVSGPEWLELVRDRLVELVDDGLREEFLVLALRDEIGRTLTNLGDVAKIEAVRSDTRDNLERSLSDPAAWDRYRRSWATTHPGDPELTDAEVIEHLQSMLNREHVNSIGADDVAERWTTIDRWRDLAAAAFNDDDLEHWRIARLARYRRHG